MTHQKAQNQSLVSNEISVQPLHGPKKKNTNIIFFTTFFTTTDISDTILFLHKFIINTIFIIRQSQPQCIMKKFSIAAKEIVKK